VRNSSTWCHYQGSIASLYSVNPVLQHVSFERRLLVIFVSAVKENFSVMKSEQNTIFEQAQSCWTLVSASRPVVVFWSIWRFTECKRQVHYTICSEVTSALTTAIAVLESAGWLRLSVIDMYA
jgi:hypothetical protein